MAIQGLRDTSNFVTDGRPLNWRAGILHLQPNGTAPLFALTAAMKNRTVDDPEFNWWEKEMQTRRVALGGNLDATAGPDAIVLVSGGLGLKIGDLLLVEESGEILTITVITSDTAITVNRSFGAVAATAVLFAGAGVNPNMTVIGNVFEEGSNAPVGVSFDPTKKFNYTEIFRSTFEMTRTASVTRLRTGDQIREAKRETLELHSSDIERALWFGERIETTQNSKPARMMGGIESFIDAGNKVTAGATTDLETLEGWLKDAFAFGSSEKMGFTGNTGMLILQQIIRKNTTYQIVTGEKEFGMNVSRLITPFGVVVLKTHPLFNQMTGGITAATAYQSKDANLYILDMAELTFVKLKGGDTQFQSKLQTNDLDAMQQGYLSEVSMEVHHPKSHFQISGLVAATADT